MEKGGRKKYITERNGRSKELLHSAHANGMNECMNEWSQYSLLYYYFICF